MMRYRTAAAFRTALEAHLNEHARRTDTSVQRWRRAVAFERLLARLLIVTPEGWTLKGALALDFRLGVRARATRDMDLVCRDDPGSATAALRAAAIYPMDDFFGYIVEQTDRLDKLENATATRYHVRAELAGRIFEEMIVDIGFTTARDWGSEPLHLPDLLAFAAIEPIIVPVLPLAEHVAEKLHAYTRGYGDGTQRSTREKDLVDLVLIADFCSFDAQALRKALEETFALRGKQTLPVGVPPPSATWGPGYRKMATAVGIDPDVLRGHARVAAFLDPC
jgi:hypothetical protein